ncbi:hypothetical protein ACFV1V_11210, partial [Streptomyces globisporus]
MTTELPVPSQESARSLLRPGSRIFVAGHRGLGGGRGGGAPPRARARGGAPARAPPTPRARARAG